MAALPIRGLGDVPTRKGPSAVKIGRLVDDFLGMADRGFSFPVIAYCGLLRHDGVELVVLAN
jgi:hypothetical protein